MNEEAWTEGPPVDCPITALGGHDDEWVKAERLEEWRTLTTGAFQRFMFAGDHFYFTAATTRRLFFDRLSLLLAKHIR